MDGPSIIERLALSGVQVVGAVDTDEVLFILRTGLADAGLLHMTDLRTDPRIEIGDAEALRKHTAEASAAYKSALALSPDRDTRKRVNNKLKGLGQ